MNSTVTESNLSNIYYILSVDGSKLRDISQPTDFHCEVALSSYPLALEWTPVEFQNRFPISVEQAVLREPTAIVYDRRTKSIVETIRDILRANERASLGKTSISPSHDELYQRGRCAQIRRTQSQAA